MLRNIQPIELEQPNRVLESHKNFPKAELPIPFGFKPLNAFHLHIQREAKLGITQ